MVGFIDAAGVDPGVVQPILPRLIDTEQQFGISRLVFPSILLDIVEGDLIIVSSPGVGQDGVGGRRRSHAFSQSQLALRVDV